MLYIRVGDQLGGENMPLDEVLCKNSQEGISRTISAKMVGSHFLASLI